MFRQRLAPEFKSIVGWLNAKPLTLEELRGKVILLDFWTYSCVNCLRTLPHMKMLHEKYGGKGFMLIGVHAPEFEFEKDPGNVKLAVHRLGISYPVAIDSSGATWHAYGNTYWPRQAIIDPNGKIRFEHVGEGGYSEIEKNIRNLLSEADVKLEDAGETDEKIEPRQVYEKFMTPETYCGSERNPGLGSAGVCKPDGTCGYNDPGVHELDVVYVDGDWKQWKEFLHHASGSPGHILLKFSAREANAVMDSSSGKKARVYVELDGNPLTKENAGKDIKTENGKSFIEIDSPGMYELVSKAEFGTHELKMETDSPDFRVYVYTFG